MNVYWWDETSNFGDKLTKHLLERFFGAPVTLASPEDAELFCVGSISGAIPDNYAGYIFGSGVMHETERYDWTTAKVLGLRGKLTQERVIHTGTPILGDPGLLLRYLPMIPIKKRYKLGIIPHYVDKGDCQVYKWAKRRDVTLIDIQVDVDSVITQTAECCQIVSSALHGCILADALGIPNKWVKLSDKVGGGSFKFRDYYSVFDMEPEITDEINYVTEWSRPNLNKVCSDLLSGFIKFGKDQGWNVADSVSRF